MTAVQKVKGYGVAKICKTWIFLTLPTFSWSLSCSMVASYTAACMTDHPHSETHDKSNNKWLMTACNTTGSDGRTARVLLPMQQLPPTCSISNSVYQRKPRQTQQTSCKQCAMQHDSTLPLPVHQSLRHPVLVLRCEHPVSPGGSLQSYSWGYPCPCHLFQHLPAICTGFEALQLVTTIFVQQQQDPCWSCNTRIQQLRLPVPNAYQWHIGLC